MLIAKNLHLEVSSACKIFLQEYRTIAKRRPRLALGLLQQTIQLRRVMNDAHTPPAAAHRGFNHYRVTNLICSFVRRGVGFHRFGSTGQHRNARRSREPSRRRFIAQQFQEIRGRSNKFNPSLFACARKCRIFRKKSIPRMDRINFFFLRQRHDPRNIEIRLYRPLAGANQIGLIRFKAVQRQPVFLRIDRHGAQPKLIGSAKNPDSDLAPIGRQQFSDRPATFHSEGTTAEPCAKFYIVSSTGREAAPSNFALAEKK